MPVVSCPRCSTRLKVDDDLDLDDRVECTKCGKRFAPPQEASVHRAKKVQHAGGCAGGCAMLIGFALVVGVCGGAWLGWSHMKQQAFNDLAEGDRLYAANKKIEAAKKYETAYSFAPDDRKGQLVGRIVDAELSAGNTKTAREYVEIGLNAKLNVTYETDAARDLHAQVQRERAEAQAKKQAEREAKERADKEAEAKRQRYGDSSDATLAAQIFVKRQLAFPAEAKFGFLDRDTAQNKDGSWKVSGVVTSKNAFGVKVKFRFQVTVVKQENGDWREVEPVALAESD